ncbi:hypothetical protein [Fibrella aquatica]|uniref:hypothetical protein n=1 Tax=Fibrella aquatica TaxID=3242487 RepID=UPI003521F507
MKRLFLFPVLCAVLSACATSQPTSGHQPVDETEYYVKAAPIEELNHRLLPDPIGGLGHSSDSQLRVTDIRLTAKYTVLYLTFDLSKGQYGSSATSQISIDPKAQLVSLDGKETFNFVKAEGIRLSPDTSEIQAGSKAKFVLYFERLTPGVDQFALFECKDSPGLSCWNITDMHVENPANQ